MISIYGEALEQVSAELAQVAELAPVSRDAASTTRTASCGGSGQRANIGRPTSSQTLGNGAACDRESRPAP